jgi:DNA-directed RNA polymerase specialized sigma24 family protein
MMSPVDSFSAWLAQLKEGDNDAAARLWQRYFSRLVELARARLALCRAARDEEDVALSAFASFCRAAAAGRFPRLNDHGDLWRVLLVIVRGKACDEIERQRSLRRGGGERRVEIDLDRLAGAEPTPELAAAVADECEHLLKRLQDGTLRRIATWKMEGYTVEEIAANLGVVPRTVERKLRVIRETWEAAA